MPKTHRDGTVSHAALGLVAVPPSVLAHALANQVHPVEGGEDVFPGTSSSPSQPQPEPTPSTSGSGSPRRARTTGNPSSRRRAGDSSAGSTGGSTPGTGKGQGKAD